MHVCTHVGVCGCVYVCGCVCVCVCVRARARVECHVCVVYVCVVCVCVCASPFFSFALWFYGLHRSVRVLVIVLSLRIHTLIS
jgi:hypothetical protein